MSNEKPAMYEDGNVAVRLNPRYPSPFAMMVTNAGVQYKLYMSVDEARRVADLLDAALTDLDAG